MGRFGGCKVSASKGRQLARFEGRYIELEILTGGQPINPGPWIVDTIGEIKPLDRPAIQVSARLLAPAVGGNRRCEVAIRYKNVGSKEVELDPNDVRVGLLGYAKVENPDVADKIFAGDTRNANLAFVHELHQWNPSWGIRIRLQPDDEIAFVLDEVWARVGEYELAADVTYHDGKEWIPTSASLRETRYPSGALIALPRRQLLTIQAKVSKQGDEYLIEGSLHRRSMVPSHRDLHSRPGQSLRQTRPGDIGIHARAHYRLGEQPEN